jgi:hypothetical protein
MSDCALPRRYGAWIRYGEPITVEQLEFAAGRYRVAILQPWETAAAVRLKAADPAMTVLTYKCLSSARGYERGPIFTSGVSMEEAEEAGEYMFAHRLDGSRIEWNSYGGHWQMAVWDPDYQERWIGNVLDELEDSPWDGVMADNDVFRDYYGLKPPLEGGREMPDLRAALDTLVQDAGKALNDAGKLLVPNIAESRLEPGRWARHAAFGGGFEEVFLAYGEQEYLGVAGAIAQGDQVSGPGLTIFRTATDGSSTHPNLLYGLAAFWVFGGGHGGAFAGTSHDGYSVAPHFPELDWDLGEPVGEARQRGNGYSREFTGGFAAVNFNEARRRKITWSLPADLVDGDGEPAGRVVTVQPHRGVLLRRG